MSNQNEWQDVDEQLPNWNPIYTGSKKNSDIKYLDVSENSTLVGYYLGKREFYKDDRSYTVHKFRADEIGDKAHCPNFEAGGEVECFGSAVLHGLLAEKVKAGQYVKVQYMGKQKKKQGDDMYHNWKVFVNASKTPLTVSNGMVVDAPAAAVENIPNGGETAPAEAVDMSADDDLPF